MTEPTRMEDSRKDNLGVEKMMNGDRKQSMEENEDKKVEIQQMLGSAKSNQGFPFVNLTMQVGVMIFGEGNIEQVVVWDQKTAQAVTFVLKSTLDRNAQPWLPQGRGQESKEDEVVEEEDKNTESTEVETMSYERLAEAVDKQKAADDVEADFEKEKGDVSKASEQKILDESEADDVEETAEQTEPESECEPVIKCMEKEFDRALDDDHSAADSDDVDSEYAIHSRPSNVLKHDLRWTDENLKYLKGQSVRWQKVLWFEDHMFAMNLQDGIVYIDPWGVPCDMEQSSLAAFEDLLRTS